MKSGYSIIVHGGAGAIRPGREGRKRAGCKAAARAGAAILAAGGSAIDAVEAAIRLMEDDAVFNAGFGSVLNADGEVETDAALMDGATLNAGAVCALKGVANPITVARALLPEVTVMLAAEGGYRFARTHGGVLVDPKSMISPERADEAKDTVGAVAFDQSGNLAAGTSTGGINRKPAGRVGDSPIIGAGLYAQNGVGGASYTGDGEAILRLASAARLMADLAVADAHTAAANSMGLLTGIGGEGGVIALDAVGRPAFAHNSPHIAVGIATSEREARAFLTRQEWDGR